MSDYFVTFLDDKVVTPDDFDEEPKKEWLLGLKFESDVDLRDILLALHKAGLTPKSFMIYDHKYD